MTRADRIVIQIVVREDNEDGLPLSEKVTTPITLFRASTPDVWAFVDANVKHLEGT